MTCPSSSTKAGKKGVNSSFIHRYSIQASSELNDAYPLWEEQSMGFADSDNVIRRHPYTHTHPSPPPPTHTHKHTKSLKSETNSKDS